jgi:hypothetical protein
VSKLQSEKKGDRMQNLTALLQTKTRITAAGKKSPAHLDVCSSSYSREGTVSKTHPWQNSDILGRKRTSPSSQQVLKVSDDL